MRRLIILIFLFGLQQNVFSYKWKIEFLPGITYAFPMPLSISQKGFSDISLTAKYKTRDYELPIYYSFRLGVGVENKFWEVELNHLKLYLDNKPAEVQHFGISHGYNQIFINRMIEYRRFDLRIGIGGVLTHPETTVRNKEYTTAGLGYHFNGICSQVAIQKRLNFTKYSSVNFEGKLTVGYAKIPISDGHADVPSIVIHLLIGLEGHWEMF